MRRSRAIRLTALLVLAVGTTSARIPAAEPSEAEKCVSQGLNFARMRDYDRAIAEFTEAIRLDPESDEANAYFFRGQTWVYKHDFDRAIADYDATIRLNPETAQVYECRGKAWFFKQDYDRALADYTEAIRLDPKNVEGFIDRAMIWSSRKDHDRAIADYTEVVRLTPKSAFAYLGRGHSWSLKTEYARALADYDEALRINPKDVWGAGGAYLGRAWLWATCPDAKFRNAAKAVESATRGCELTEWKNPLLVDVLAAALAESGDFDAAVKREEQALGTKMELPTREDLDADFLNRARARLELSKARKPYRAGPEGP